MNFHVDPEDSENHSDRKINSKPLIVLDGVLDGLAVTPELALAMALKLGQAYDDYCNWGEAWNGIRIPRITVVGLGGFGNHVASYLPSLPGLDRIPSEEGPEYIGLDTDYPLGTLNINTNLTRQTIPLVVDDVKDERSCDGWPSRARRAIWHEFGESSDLTEQLKGVDFLFLVAGLGRGAGTGLSQAVACHARHAGVLTIALVTLPLSTETLNVTLKHEMRRLMQCADAVIAISQDDAAKFAHRATLSDHDARALVASDLADCASGLILSVLRPHPKDIDTKEFRAFFSKAGMVGYVHATVRIWPASEKQPIIRFNAQGIPSHIARVLVSVDSDTEVNLGDISEQILQKVTCPPDCLTIINHNRGSIGSPHCDAYIWWATHPMSDETTC